jgi:PAS domain S-box-containing protein
MTIPNDQFHLLIDSVLDYAIFLLDVSGTVVSWNIGAERIKGYRGDEIIGQNFSRFYTREDLQRGLPQRALEIAAREGRYEQENWRVRKDGSHFWANVVITALRDDTGQLVGYGKVTRDLTERKRAEDRFRALLQSAPDAIILVDQAGQIALVNTQTETLFGYPREELLGRTVDVLLPERYRGRHPDYRMDYQGNPRIRQMGTGLELFGLRKDGNEFPVEISLSPLQTDQGQLVIAAIRDITERKIVNAQLERSRVELQQLTERLETTREEERARLAREIHDELGQQITGLKMSTAWLEKHLGSGDSPERLQKKTHEMSEIIDAMLQTVRHITTNLRPTVLDHFGLREAVEWLARDFKSWSGLELTVTTTVDNQLPSNEVKLTIFRMLQEALTNVVRHAHASRVDVTLDHEQGNLICRVQDNGQGMVDSARKAGSLGLIGMRERARLVGGTLSIESVPGQGTTITVTIPLQESNVDNQQSPGPSPDRGRA